MLGIHRASAGAGDHVAEIVPSTHLLAGIERLVRRLPDGSDRTTLAKIAADAQ